MKTPTTNNIDKKDWIMILGTTVGVSLASFVLYNGLSTTLRLWQKWSMTTTTKRAGMNIIAMFENKKLLIADIIFGGVIFYLFIAMVLAQVKVANSNDIGERISANLFFVFVIYIDTVLGVIGVIVHFRLKRKKHSRIYGAIQ